MSDNQQDGQESQFPATENGSMPPEGEHKTSEGSSVELAKVEDGDSQPSADANETGTADASKDEAPGTNAESASPEAFKTADGMVVRPIELTEAQEKLFNKAKKLSTAAMICALVSLFIGGVLLSTAGLVCGIIAYRTIKPQMEGSGDGKSLALMMRRSVVLGIAFSCVSLGLNAFAVWQMFPQVMDAINSGSLDSLYGDMGVDASSGTIDSGATGADTSSGSKTWG